MAFRFVGYGVFPVLLGCFWLPLMVSAEAAQPRPRIMDELSRVFLNRVADGDIQRVQAHLVHDPWVVRRTNRNPLVNALVTCAASRECGYDLANLLMDKGVNSDERISDDDLLSYARRQGSPIKNAIRRNNYAVLEALLEHPDGPRLRRDQIELQSDGRKRRVSALEFALGFGDARSAALLIEYGGFRYLEKFATLSGNDLSPVSLLTSYAAHKSRNDSLLLYRAFLRSQSRWNGHSIKDTLKHHEVRYGRAVTRNLYPREHERIIFGFASENEYDLMFTDSPPRGQTRFPFHVQNFDRYAYTEVYLSELQIDGDFVQISVSTRTRGRTLDLFTWAQPKSRTAASGGSRRSRGSTATRSRGSNRGAAREIPVTSRVCAGRAPTGSVVVDIMDGGRSDCSGFRNNTWVIVTPSNLARMSQVQVCLSSTTPPGWERAGSPYIRIGRCGSDDRPNSVTLRKR